MLWSKVKYHYTHVEISHFLSFVVVVFHVRGGKNSVMSVICALGIGETFHIFPFFMTQ